MKKAAKKKPKARRKVMRVALVPQPVPSDPAATCAVLEALLLSPGWQVVERELTENIAFLEEAIMDKKDPSSGEDIEDEEVDRLRYKRAISLELKKTPRRLIERLSVHDEADDRDDPYETAEDVREARRKK